MTFSLERKNKREPINSPKGNVRILITVKKTHPGSTYKIIFIGITGHLLQVRTYAPGTACTSEVMQHPFSFLL